MGEREIQSRQDESKPIEKPRLLSRGFFHFSNKSTRKHLRVLFILTSLIGFSSPAYAYIPPSQFILKTWVNKHKGIKSIRIKSTVTAVDESKSTHPTFKEVFYFSLDRQTMYSWAMDESEHRLFGKSRTGAGNTVTTLLTVGSDLHELIRTLKQKEIPIKTDEDLASLKLIQERVAAETEFLSRWNGAPAWVIGDSNGPQLWVEKDSFLPLRLICSMASPQGTQSLDLRFENYRHYREIPLARTTSVADRSGKVLITSQVTDVVINPDISSLKAYDREADGKFTEAGSKSSDELRELIRLYYEVVR